MPGVQPAGPPRTLTVGQAAEAASLESVHPVFHRAGSITQKAGCLGATHALGDQQNAVQPMVVARLIGAAYLVLQCQNHFFGIRDGECLHTHPRKHIPPLCAIIYVAEYSTLVFPFILPITLAKLNGKEDLNQIRPDPFGVSWPDNPWKKDEPVRIGDFVITENEYQKMGEFLETKNHQSVRIQDLPNHKIDFGTLISGISMIRSIQQIADCKEIFRAYSGEKQVFALICQLGIRFESYVCEDVTGSRQADQNSSARTAVFERIARAYFKRIYGIFKTL
ncbi:MAG TPA: hypothetical protein VGY98_12005 [Verrucomicrobiae bacterium]|nr:hypothetical protein [Verrucomicrobiae bacterium]